MATFSVPGQNLSYSIPDDGQVFIASNRGVGYLDSIYIRKGNNIVQLSPQNMATSYLQSQGVNLGQITSATGAQLGLGPNGTNDPQYNPAVGAMYQKAVSLGMQFAGANPSNYWTGNLLNTGSYGSNTLANFGQDLIAKQLGVTTQDLFGLPQYNMGDVMQATGFMGGSTSQSTDPSILSKPVAADQWRDPQGQTHLFPTGSSLPSGWTKIAQNISAPNYAGHTLETATSFGGTQGATSGGINQPTGTGEIVTLKPSTSNPNAPVVTSSTTGTLFDPVATGQAPAHSQPGALDPTQMASLANPNADWQNTGSTAGFTAPATVGTGTNQPAAQSTPTDPSQTQTATLGQVTPGNNAAVTAPVTLNSNVTASGTGTTPMFMGNTALIQIQGYPGTYLVDTTSKTIRPFASDQAVVHAFPGITADHIVTLTPAQVSLGGMFGANNGYQILDSKYAIQNDGKFLSQDASPSQLQARYGQPINTNAEQDAYMVLDGVMGAISGNPNGGIPSAFIDTLKTDKSALAFMISAMAYGGYTANDAVSDIKRRYLVSQGDTSLSTVTPISATQDRTTYQKTDAGKQALSNPKLTPPVSLGDLDPSIMKLPIFQIPAEAFKTLIPIMNPDTQEFKDAVSKIQDAYHDVILQQLSATTEQQKAVADANWASFKSSAEKQLGITLSNNALDAWTQIQNARQQFANNGISGSGLENESVDDYLKRVRSQDNQSREYTHSQEDSQQALYYQKYATPQQVKDLIASDPAKAQSYGLVPSADIKNAMSFSTLKAKYPSLSDKEINDYIASVLDENGNYRSSLYQTYMTNQLSTKSAEQTYKEGMVMQNSLNDEAKAYREFTTPDSPFLRDVTDPNATPAQYGDVSNVMSALGNAPGSSGAIPMSGGYVPTPAPTGTGTPGATGSTGGYNYNSIANLPNIGPGTADTTSTKALQSWLVQNGFMSQAQMDTGPGVYGPQTTSAVAAWQSKVGMNTGGNPGYFGPLSKTFIGSSGSSTPSTTTSASTPNPNGAGNAGTMPPVQVPQQLTSAPQQQSSSNSSSAIPMSGGYVATPGPKPPTPSAPALSGSQNDQLEAMKKQLLQAQTTLAGLK